MNRSPQASALAVTRLLAEHRASVRHQLAGIVPDGEVEDLLQEVFVKAARALPEFRGEASVATWLHRIAERTAFDHLRSRHHREALRTFPLDASKADATGEIHPPAGLIEPAVVPARLVQQEMHGCIREFVERLSPDYRRMVELKDLVGLTNAEIADHLGISLDAAKVRLHRARGALRQLLADGCELYRGDSGSLACDRRPSPPVSLPGAISSKEIQPEAGCHRAVPHRLNPNNSNPMTSTSSCGCAAPETGASAVAPSVSLFTAQVAEFVAIGAAIGANCEPCLRYHVREAEKLGISSADIARAIALAAQVKETPARTILKLAARLTQSGDEQDDKTVPGPCGCAEQIRPTTNG